MNKFVVGLCALVTLSSVSGWTSELNNILKTPAVQKELDAIVKSPETLNKVTLLHLGENSLPVRQNLIANAKNFVFISVPFWFADQTGVSLLNSLQDKQKKDSQFDFRVIQDWASPFLSKGGRKIHEALGESTVLWNSPGWQRNFSFHLKQHHVHEKLFLVDGDKMIIGGMNIADEYLEGGKTKKGWHDTDLLIEGPAAQEGTAVFLKMWQLAKYLATPQSFPPWTKPEVKAFNDFFYNNIEDHNFETVASVPPYKVTNTVHIPILSYLKNPKYFPKIQSQDGGVPVRLIYDNPLFERDVNGKRVSMTEDAVEYVMKQAKKTAWFFMPYFTPNQDFLGDLVDAAKNLDVRIVTNSGDSWDMKIAGYKGQLSHYPALLKAGIKIYEWQGHKTLKAALAKGCQIKSWPGDTLHTKMALFDGSVAFVGSNNLNNMSFRNNSEVMALINDEKFGASIKDIFTRDIDGRAIAEGKGCGSFPLVKQVSAEGFKALANKYQPSATPVWAYPIGF